MSLSQSAFQPTYKIIPLHLCVSISADEILGVRPSHLPKMPASPLLAFLYGPRKSLCVPAGGHSPLLALIYPPHVRSAVIG